ncbi:cupin domain-containing protein [Dactylosporangium cerinum]|uniref:Cupin domain-containing protein n=1 Tax=Dactylosporangium cerinum TaxID=1434730 RepID=A0ABV9VVC9_9ACTN
MTVSRPATVGTTAHPAVVHGVHGAAGATRWTCFAGRRQLSSPCEAVEWASIPAGGISGEHLHSRTEESYLILSGQGELLLDGVAHPVRAGSLALTGIGHTHGLRNVGDSDLDWLVVESIAPATDRALRGHSSEGAPMGGVVLRDLFADGVVDTAGVFTGPLRRIESLDVTAPVVLGHDDTELAVYVVRGHGALHSDATGDVALFPGTCVLVPAGARARVTSPALHLAVVHLAVAP